MPKEFNVLVFKKNEDKKELVKDFVIKAEDLTHAFDVAYVTAFSIEEDFLLEVTPVKKGGFYA